MLGIYGGIMAFLFFLGVPIGFAIIVSTAIYLLYTGQLDLIVIPHKLQETMDSFPLLAVPFFILSGELMSKLKVTGKLVELSSAIVGPLRGSLGHVNVLTGMLMAGVSGSGTADAAALGSVLIPAMEKDGYEPDFAAALTACSGAIGPVIPPSILMVVYGSIAEVSVGRLFLGGAVPGIIMGLALMCGVYFISKRRNYGSRQATSARRIFRAFVSGIPALAVPVVIVGGIVGGVFTPTESSIAAVTVTLVAGVLYGSISLRAVTDALRNTVYILGPVMFVVAASGIFGWILSAQEAGRIIANFLLSVSSSPTMFLLIIVVILLILGCFMEVLAILIVLSPMLKPVIFHLGIDPVYFGVLMTFSLAIGLITPPVGMCMYVSCSIARVSMEQFFRQAIPFLIALFVLNFLLVFFPQLIMFLPNLLMPVK